MSYKAIDIAKYITNRCIEDEHPISNLQLQKIMYYVQYDFLKNRKQEELFSDDFEAWKFGPVVHNVYSFFCGFGGFPIDIKLKISSPIDNESKKYIDDIVKAKRDKNPWELVQETHKPNRAWAIIYNKGKGVYDTIPKVLIKTKGF